MSKKDYHSAIKGFDVKNVEPIEYYKDDNLTTFVFDADKDRIPKEFKMADFIWIEPPWKKGYEEFNRRANKPVRWKGWESLIIRSHRICQALRVPYFITGGKQFKSLIDSNYVNEIYWSVHKSNTLIFSNVHFHQDNSDELLKHLFSKHETVLDFCCGYGHTFSNRVNDNNKAILTDLNPHCVGFVKSKYENISKK